MPNRGANRARVGSQLGIADGVRSLIHTTEQRVVSGYSTAPRSSHRGAVCFAKRTRRRAGALAQTSAHLHHARSDPVLTSVNGVLHTTNYFHDGDNLWVIAIADGKQLVSVTTSYPGIDQPHSIYQNGAISYYLQDVSGNITGLVNNAGTLQNHYSYLPFGGADTTVEAVTNTLKFAAREYDSEIGLYYMRARYYDPGMGRFISEDPAGITGSINVYAYANNVPTDLRDPWGLCTTDMSDFDKTLMEDSGVAWCIGSSSSSATQTWFGGFRTGGPSSPFGPFGPDAPARGIGGTTAESPNGPTVPSAPQLFRSSVTRSPRVCSGGFIFGTGELDLGVAFGAVGGIAESNSPGLDVGSLYEGGIGGEGGFLGLAVVRSASTNQTRAYGMLGVGLSAGPHAGAQIGIIFRRDEIGMFYEGHVGAAAGGAGHGVGKCN